MPNPPAEAVARLATLLKRHDPSRGEDTADDAYWQDWASRLLAAGVSVVGAPGEPSGDAMDAALNVLDGTNGPLTFPGLTHGEDMVLIRDALRAAYAIDGVRAGSHEPHS